jgi:hypothetical protein
MIDVLLRLFWCQGFLVSRHFSMLSVVYDTWLGSKASFVGDDLY